MVESNLQRSVILPSEKAFSYKMRLDAMNRQGERTDLTSAPVGQKFSRESLAELTGDSHSQIQRYIRLTELIPTLLDVVDEGRIGMRPAVELSYLSKDEQSALADAMSYMDCTPSHDQAIRMRKMSGEGKLTPEAIEAIMGEVKPNQREKISFRADRLRQYIPKNISPSQTEDYVMKALEHYASPTAAGTFCPAIPVGEEESEEHPGIYAQLSEELIVYAIWYERYQCYIAIRKLTPKECFRLQGWTDDYYERAAFVNSNNQLYKQAGNGVTVSVVYAIGYALSEAETEE